MPQPEASIFTYIALDKHDPRVMTWAQFAAKYPVVRAPEWAMTRAEKAALEPPKSVIAVSPKKGGRRAA